jgi:hypothetical protein
MRGLTQDEIEITSAGLCPVCVSSCFLFFASATTTLSGYFAVSEEYYLISGSLLILSVATYTYRAELSGLFLKDNH